MGVGVVGAAFSQGPSRQLGGGGGGKGRWGQGMTEAGHLFMATGPKYPST